jgi:hypothetical protein
MELNGGRPSWQQFIQLVNARFRPPLIDTSLNELAMLCRSGTTGEFAKRFMALSYRDPSITESHQIQPFITGLGDPLRLDVVMPEVKATHQTMEHAETDPHADASAGMFLYTLWYFVANFIEFDNVGIGAGDGGDAGLTLLQMIQGQPSVGGCGWRWRANHWLPQTHKMLQLLFWCFVAIAAIFDLVSGCAGSRFDEGSSG